MEFITTKQAAERWGISQRRVAILCEQGRISGAQKAGIVWLIPPDAKKPADGRRKGKSLTTEGSNKTNG
ncbi:helix-turn-helix domain-containing protein [Oscillospiraceae bacterium OttesenSCG-928-G22]|nr:helix-turn-helix domain-containing protein [Oscillospiraceae bacterium OttesenSCG-928-G22]